MISIILITKNGSLDRKNETSILMEKNQYIFEYGKEVTIVIADIRNVIKDIHTKNSIHRSYIFHHFDNTSLVVQNSLLKTLEEVPKNVQFLLVAKNIHKILPTIQSRCKIIKSSNKQEISEENKDIENVLTQITLKNLSSNILQPTSRDEAIDLLQNSIYILRNYIHNHSNQPNLQSYINLVKYTLQTISYLENNNLNPQLAVDKWYIQVKKMLQ